MWLIWTWNIDIPVTLIFLSFLLAQSDKAWESFVLWYWFSPWTLHECADSFTGYINAGVFFTHNLCINIFHLFHTLCCRLCVTKENDRKVPLYSIHTHPIHTHEFCVGGRDPYIRIYDTRMFREVIGTRFNTTVLSCANKLLIHQNITQFNTHKDSWAVHPP